MRAMLALFLSALAAPTTAPPLAAARERERVAVTVITLDALRQGQERYGRALLESLGDARGGPFDIVPAGVGPDLFGPCIEDRMDHGLDYCVRFYLTRAELPADGPPVVVVALDDDPGEGSRGFGGEELRASCFGRGTTPAGGKIQDTTLWPGAERMHGMRDLERDRDALAACISAAASERWTGLREPDPL